MDSNFVVYSCYVKFEVTDKSKKHFSWSTTLIDRGNDVKNVENSCTTRRIMVLHCKVLSSPRELRGPCLNPPSPFCHGGMWLITVTIVIKLLLPGRAKTMFYNVSFAASFNFVV